MLRPVRRAKFIPDQVEMNVMIDLYTEKTVEVPVFGVNFPGSKDLRTFPSKVKVTFRVGMSRFKGNYGGRFCIGCHVRRTNEEPQSENTASSKVDAVRSIECAYRTF